MDQRKLSWKKKNERLKKTSYEGGFLIFTSEESFYFLLFLQGCVGASKFKNSQRRNLGEKFKDFIEGAHIRIFE